MSGEDEERDHEGDASGDSTDSTGASDSPGGAAPPNSTPTIRELDDRTVRQIAAGEVVERPASVVKELVENSLDAGADRISVAVEAGGTEGIRVRDDGFGMNREAVERAVEEHTTSKIDDIADLEAGVGTLGFRGEALHTIGAVSRLTIRTKPRGGDAPGTELRVEGGEVTAVETAGCPAGTAVVVNDLFYNTPARRKFLKTIATEFDHVNTVVTHYALANPDVAISLEHDDREVFATEGRGNLQSAVLSVYGREVAESMIRVDCESGASPTGTESDSTVADSDSRVVEAVTGLVSHPETTRSTREYLSTFVNGRYVTAGVLREAVLDAYGGQLAADRYPFAVLFVEIASDAVDVNVHPRKMEVRFDDEAGVRDAVTTAVREALLEEGLIRSSAPRGRSAPAETEIDPESPASEVRGGAGHGDSPERSDGRVDRERGDHSRTDRVGGSIDDGTDEAGGVSSNARIDADAFSDDSGESDPSAARTVDPDSDDAWTVSKGESGTELDDDSDEDEGVAGDRTPISQSSDESGLSNTRSRTSEAGRRTPEGSDRPNLSPRSSETSESSDSTSGADDPKPDRSRTRDRIPTGVVGPTVQRDLGGEAATLEPDFESLPSMRVLGQLHDTYVVAESDDGLLLIDQHAADERVHYERLQRELDGEVATQALANPVELELTAREAALFGEYRETLSALGFRAERAGDRTVEVRSVPAVFAETLDPELLRDALSAFVTAGEDAETVESVADELLADLACYPSVTGNTSLTEGSVVELLEALDECENPYACPHGRPVVVSIDAEEIGSRFERDYPGHGGRR